MFQAIQNIINLLEDKTVLKGEFIFREGDNDPYFYIVSVGLVEINNQTKTGKTKIIATVKAGESFGEGALSRNVKDHLRPANAIALEDTHLMILHRDKFNKLLKENPESASSFLYTLLEITYARLRWSNAELLTLYEIGRYIGQYIDNLETLAQKTLAQLCETTKSQKAIMVMRNNLTNEQEVVGQIGDFKGMKIPAIFKMSSIMLNQSEKLEKYGLPKEKIILASIPSIGFILLSRPKTARDYPEEYFKLLQSASEQIRSAIERSRKIRDEKAKKLYNQRKMQYNF